MIAVELVTIGTELLLGFTVDSNAAFLGQALSAAGIRIVRRSTVADTPDDIRAAVDEALRRTGAVITTGGLGPTRDDMSRNVVADLLGLPLEFHDEVWQQILARYARFGRTPVESNRSQAMVPRGATALANAWGTAPGLWIESSRGLVVMLPGVPLEMRQLTQTHVLPRLRARAGDTAIVSRTLRTVGVPESTLAERISAIESALDPLTLAYLPGVTGVDLRLTAWNLAPDRADTLLRDACRQLRDAVGEQIYGEDDADLAEIVLDQMRAGQLKLAVAESCTGGLLGGRITAIAGASDVFLGGVIAYDNAIKTTLLDVDAEMMAANGAVSSEVAAAMASGVARRFDADVGLSITGIAGPAGGTPEKPVGTVWFAMADRDGVITHKSVFGGDRAEIRARAAQGALLLAWKALLAKR